MRKSNIVCSVFLLSLIFFCVVIGIYRQYELTHFSCTTMVVASNDNYRLSAQMKLQVNGEKGSIAADGTIVDKQGVSLPFRMIVSISVTQDRNYYTLVNNAFIDLYGNYHNAEMIDIFPPFLKEKKSVITTTRYKQGSKGFIFTHSSSMAYCKLDGL